MTRDSRLFDRIASFGLTLAALVIAAVLVKRELQPRGQVSSATDKSAKRVSAFDSVVTGVGASPSPGVTHVIVFSDYECPACRVFAAVEDSVRQAFGSSVMLTHAHFPLQSHRFAELSAVAAECGRQFGRFEDFSRVLFVKQDSIGLLTWQRLASEAGVADTAKFSSCVLGQKTLGTVRESRRVGEAIEVSFTPTIIVDGWRLNYVPSWDDLRAIIKEVQSGRSPFNSKGRRI